jgi:intracellular septation protein A
MVIIVIGCITQEFMDNQFIYYKFFIIPTILFYVLASLNIWNNYKKLKANIDEVEKSQYSFSTI